MRTASFPLWKPNHRWHISFPLQLKHMSRGKAKAPTGPVGPGMTRGSVEWTSSPTTGASCFTPLTFGSLPGPLSALEMSITQWKLSADIVNVALKSLLYFLSYTTENLKHKCGVLVGICQIGESVTHITDISSWELQQWFGPENACRVWYVHKTIWHHLGLDMSGMDYIVFCENSCPNELLGSVEDSRDLDYNRASQIISHLESFQILGFTSA